MYSRIALIASALFWLTMNYLLWRSEFGRGSRLGSDVPVEVVWRKILTAPDNSSLDIYHHGKKAGYCRWTAGSGRNAPADPGEELPTPPPAPEPAGYRLDLEGSLAVGRITNRLQFELDLKLASPGDWQEADLRFASHDGSVAIRTLASEKTVRLRVLSGGERVEQSFTFADLQNPRALAQAIELPLPFDFFGAPDLVTNAPAGSLPGLGLAWEARNDWLRIGHASVRVYRLQSTVLDGYSAAVFVSRVGEILRVELPDEWTLVNDEAGGF